MAFLQATPTGIIVAITVAIATSLFLRAFYNLYLHPLSKFSGPWYARAFSISGAIVSLLRIEPQWLQSLAERYGTDTPIRISPTMLLFPKPSALKEIYWDPDCNQKSGIYGTGILGPPHLFSTLDGEEHKRLRKALSNAPWSIGALKRSWESRIDDLVLLFISKMQEKAESGEKICFSDKVAEFSADTMSMLSFTDPWGFVQNGRDERQILTKWRQGLDFFGFVGRFRFFREVIMKIPVLNLWLLPSLSDDVGMGWLMAQADKQVTDREIQLQNGNYPEKPDFMQ